MALKPDMKEEIHVLLVAFSAQGHINPTLGLAKRLLSKGLRVSFATTEFARHRMLNLCPSTDPNSLSGIQLLFFSDGSPVDYDHRTNLDDYMDRLSKFGPINLSNLIRDHFNNTSRKLGCIIGNPFIPWVFDVASEHKIPSAIFWLQPCTIYCIYYRFYNDLNPFPSPDNPDMSVELPGLPLLHKEDLPSFVLPGNPFGSFPKLLQLMFQNMRKFKWVLANSFYEMEKEAIDSTAELHPLRPIGPLVPSSLLGEDQTLDTGIDLWKSEKHCIEFLNSKPPCSVIYVSFGSFVELSAKQTENIATGLKNSNHPFLWVVKPPRSPSQDGAGELPVEFLDETKDRGVVVSWSPQAEVLSHPSVACFLTHCGWNSLLETVAAGVPVIAYPQWTDQPTNAKLAVDVLGVGVRLRAESDGVVSSAEVEKCVKEVMSGPRSEEFRRNAEALKREARDAVSDGGSSDRNIQCFIDEIVSSASASTPEDS